MGLEPQARHFPRRNRIVSGLARAVVVVEAATKSGSLITARMALDQGREVMAVPGHPFDARASGCNMLIRDGAVLVRGANDVLAALGQSLPERSTAPGGKDPGAAATEKPRRQEAAAASAGSADRKSGVAGPRAAALTDAILGLLGPSPVAEDQLIRDLGVSPQDAAAELLSLELDGRIERRAGGLLVRLPRA
jgi:DNA processing protein